MNDEQVEKIVTAIHISSWRIWSGLMALLVATTCSRSHAMDYDVDFPTTSDRIHSTIRINIEGCDTLFKVDKTKLDSFSNNSKAMDQMIELAIAHKNAGCPTD
jgi:hypothetical protein